MTLPKNPLDSELQLFEEDLKSLNPTPFVAKLAEPRLEGTSGYPVSRSITTKRRWLGSVALAWASGLAAGMLIATLWNRPSSGENGVHIVVSDQDEATAVSDLKRPELDSSGNATPLASDTVNPRDGLDFKRVRSRQRFVSGTDGQQRILRPSTPWDELLLDNRPRSWPTTNTGSASRSTDRIEQVDTPVPLPRESTHGQREFLKRMTESDDVFSA